MIGVGVEGARLGREWVLRRQRDRELQVSERQQVYAAVEEKEAKIQKAERERWWREVGINAAWAPLTVHWSVEKGILGDGIVGALGMVAGGLALGKAWKTG